VSRSILIVEDSPDFRMLTEAVLLGAGYQVTSVCNGLEGLSYIERHGPPDLLLSDIEMPELDGIGMVRELRQRPKTTTLLVLFFSCHSDGRSRALQVDGAGFISKGPDLVRNLVGEVRRLLPQTAGVH
jgi:CheY-like chemotaxis protein